MNAERPVIALVGSARQDITHDKESQAREICIELGRELAKQGCNIAFYSLNEQFIERDIIRGYVSVDGVPERSIIGYFAHGKIVNLEEFKSHEALFKLEFDNSDDWEVSFYRSLMHVDGILALGGGTPTLIAGHIALARQRPIAAIDGFGGSSEKLWKYLGAEHRIENEQIQSMTYRSNYSAQKCIASLVSQYNSQVIKNTEQSELANKAHMWDMAVADTRLKRSNIQKTIGFLIGLLILFVSGLSIDQAGIGFTAVLFLGLLFAGGVGASIRILSQTRLTLNMKDSTDGWTPQIIGVTVGFFLSLFYLFPQLIGSSSWLTPNSKIEATTRLQYISGILIAFLSGFGFDYAIENIRRKSETNAKDVMGNSQ